MAMVQWQAPAEAGSAVRPEGVHREGTRQGVAGAGVPPGQKFPTAHSNGVEVVEPAAQPQPGGALQAPLQAGVPRLGEAP